MADGISAGDIIYRVTSDNSMLETNMNKAEGMITQKSQAIVQSLSTIGIGMTALGGAITAPLALGVSAATDFGHAMAAVATLGIEDMDSLEEAIRSIAVTYGQDLTGAAEGAYQAISAGVDAAEAPRVLEAAARAAAAGQSDLTTAIELGTSMVNAFGLEMTDMNTVFDTAFVAVKDGVTTFGELAASAGKTAPAFSAAGLSIEEMYGAVAALTKGGINTAESFTSLNAVVAAFTRQGEVSKLETLGLQGALQWLAETTNNDQTAMLEFAGSTEAMKAILALTGTQAASFTEIMADMGDKVGITGQAFEEIKERDPALAWSIMKSTMQDLAIEIGQALIPALTMITEILGPMIKAVAEFAKEHETLTTIIVTLAGAFGALLLAIGPLLIVLPGILALGTALGTVFGAGAGLTGIIGTAGGSAGLIGSVGGLATALLALNPVTIVAAAAAVSLGIAVHNTVAEFAALHESEKAVDQKTKEYVETLKEQNVALNENAMAAMSHAEQMAYLADAEKSHADILARAWFEYYAGRTESMEEFGRMRNLMLNENISSEEAAQLVLMNKSNEFYLEMMKADAEYTNSVIENSGIKETTETEALQRMTDAHYKAAVERNDIFMEATHGLETFENKAAENVQNTWSTAISNIWAMIKSLWESTPEMPALPQSPTDRKATGGITKAMTPTIVGERGRELWIPPAQGRIFNHQETESILNQNRSATVNINMGGVQVQNESDINILNQKLARTIRSELRAAGVTR